MEGQPHGVGEILECLRELADAAGHISVADIAERFGTRSYGPFLMLPAMIAITPIGAVPGVPTFLALTIAIVAVQKLFGQGHIWLPRFIARRKVTDRKLRRATARLRGLAKWLDERFHGRLTTLTHAPFSRVAALVVVALCLLVPPLELLPFAAAAPMGAIAAIGLAFLVRDGALLVGALVLSAGAFGLVGYLFSVESAAISSVFA